jgi:HK97 family phage major capsid protein
MPLLQADANNLSNNMLERGVIEEIIARDDLFALLPFVKVNGKAYVYNRENTITEGDFLDPNDEVNEGAASFTNVTTVLRILAGDVDIDKFLIATESDVNDQLAVQIALKAKALGRAFRRAVVQGDSSVNAKSFDGLARLVSTSGDQANMVIAADVNGAAITLGMLDQLLDTVLNGSDALMMRRGTWRAVRALLRAAGGTHADQLEIENFGVPIPAYNGVPILINDFLPANETQGTNANTCSVYAMRLNEVDGIHGLYGGPNAGLQVEEIGTVQNKDAFRYRVKWYCGLALKSTKSLARLQGVTNI